MSTLPGLLDRVRAEMTDPASVGVQQGRFFVGGKAIALGGLASTDRAVLRLSNPAGSGVVLKVGLITAYCDVAQQVRYNVDGTITAVGTITPWDLNLSTNGTSKADLTYGTTDVIGGTNKDNESRVAPDAPLTLRLPGLPIPPGKSLLIRGTSGAAQTFTANAYWIEDPL